MPRVAFTANLERHVACPPMTVGGRTVAEALDQVFDANPPVRPYILDERGAVRPHMTIFIDGRQITDRVRLTDPVPDDAELYIFQALSGG